MSTAPPQRRQRLAVLDGLRLLAAVMVVAYHYVTQGDTAWQRDTRTIFGPVDTITSYGWLGVELFFVISGFVICMSAWGRGVGEFFVSRVVRLYPAYWFAILAITAAVAAGPVLQTRLVSSEILVNLTMLQRPLGVPGASAVFWTLWLELHFYLLFGLVVRGGLTYRRVVLFCLLWTIASVAAEATNDPRATLLVGEDYSPFFIAGVVLYLMYRFRPTLLLWGILGVSWALAVLRTVALTRSMDQFVGHQASWRPAAIIVTLEFAVMTAVALGWLSGIRGRWLTVAGALTYPLYLLHLEIGWLLIRVLHQRVPVWPLLIGLLVAMLAVSWAVHRFVERPLAPVLKRLLTKAVEDLRRHSDPPERLAGAGFPAEPAAGLAAEPAPGRIAEASAGVGGHPAPRPVGPATEVVPAQRRDLPVIARGERTGRPAAERAGGRAADRGHRVPAHPEKPQPKAVVDAAAEVPEVPAGRPGSAAR